MILLLFLKFLSHLNFIFLGPVQSHLTFTYNESYLAHSFAPLSLCNYKILQKLIVSVSSGLSTGPHCILERVAILDASSPTVSSIVYASERAYSIWPPDSAAQTSLEGLWWCLRWSLGWKWNGGAHTPETESAYLICSVLISLVVLRGIGGEGARRDGRRERIGKKKEEWSCLDAASIPRWWSH